METMDGQTLNISNDSVNDMGDIDRGSSAWIRSIFSILYAFICITGITGNTMVIFVVAVYSKMETSTNMYIKNLAIADLCFLLALPFLIVTMQLKYWAFGYFGCKMFFICTSIDRFTGIYTLLGMSLDRYLAICHPVSSARYRTASIARFICLCIWIVSLLLMLPILLYSKTRESPNGHVSCIIEWPADDAQTGHRIFNWYAFLVGFTLPVILIIIFYMLVVLRLRQIATGRGSSEKKKMQKKVTCMVMAIISAYIICWLPYWILQIIITHMTDMRWWIPLVFKVITVFSYANSVLNPVLYGFLNENFKKTFSEMMKCSSPRRINDQLHCEQSMTLRPTKRESARQTPETQN